MADQPSPLMIALELAAMIIEPRNTIPILSNVLLTGEGGEFVVEGTDLDTEVSIVVSGVGHDADSFMASVPAEPLIAALDFLGGNAPLKARGKSELIVGDVFELPCLDPDDFHRLQPFAEIGSFTVDAVDFLNDLKACSPAMSREETRYYLNGVYLHTGGTAESPTLIMASTDGHRLMRAARRAPPIEGKVDAIIPRKLVKFLIAALAVNDAADEVSIRLGGETGVGGSTRIELSFGKVHVRARCVDGVFPDYARVIPATEQGALLVDADELRRAVAAVKVVHGRGDKTPTAILSLGGPGEKMILAENRGEGSMSLLCPGVREGDLPPRIGLNVDYLETMLSTFEGQIRIGFGDAASPVVFRDPGRRLVGVQMPMRV